MNDKHNDIIDRICTLVERNTTFKSKLLIRLLDIGLKELDREERNRECVEGLYEYCVEQILHKQAENYYKNFPFEEIVPTLMQDYIQMESFRRKDDYDHFVISAYQQIENMTNYVYNLDEFRNVVGKMWGHPTYINEKEPDKPNNDDGKKLEAYREKLDSREGSYQIARLILYNESDMKGIVEGRKKLHENHLFRLIVYYFGFKAIMTRSHYEMYVDITNKLKVIKANRNSAVHHKTGHEKSNTMKRKEMDYLEILGTLAQYTKFVQEGYIYFPEIVKYSKNCDKIEVQYPDKSDKDDLASSR